MGLRWAWRWVWDWTGAVDDNVDGDEPERERLCRYIKTPLLAEVVGPSEWPRAWVCAGFLPIRSANKSVTMVAEDDNEDDKILYDDRAPVLQRSGPSGNTAAPEAVPTGAEVVQERPKRTWRSYFWDTLDKSPEERRFLFKLDAVILTFASLGYFIKYLDQVNINNAFVSGMQDDLGLYGNELNYMITCWTVGYVIGEVPR